MVELIFSHIPKTAGKSMTKVFKDIWGPDAVAEDYNVRIDGASDPMAAYWTDWKGYCIQAERFVNTQVTEKTKVIIGHFPFLKYRSYFPDAKLSCCIRNPVDRLWSMYWYWKQIEETTSPLQALVKQAKMSFFCMVGHPMMQNQMRNYFCWDMTWDEWPHHDPDGIEVLVYENLDFLWLNYLARLGVENPQKYPLPCINKTAKKPKISQKETLEVFKRNGRDIDMWNLWSSVRTPRWE